MRLLTDEEFDNEFTTIPVPGSGDGADTWDLEDIKEHLPGVGAEHIWSMVDGDEGGTYLSGGYRAVNVFGYMVTKEPHDFDTEVELCSSEEEHYLHFEADHPDEEIFEIAVKLWKERKDDELNELYYDHMENTACG
jgi:hypothetical protein